MRRLLSITIDCEKFINRKERFIAQSGDLSLKHVSNASELIETDKVPKFLIEKNHSPGVKQLFGVFRSLTSQREWKVLMKVISRFSIELLS